MTDRDDMHATELDAIFRRSQERYAIAVERIEREYPIPSRWPTAIEWLAFAVIVGVLAVVFWRL